MKLDPANHRNLRLTPAELRECMMAVAKSLVEQPDGFHHFRFHQSELPNTWQKAIWEHSEAGRLEYHFVDDEPTSLFVIPNDSLDSWRLAMTGENRGETETHLKHDRDSTPRNLLSRWRDIVEFLGAEKDQIQRLNNRFDGPIRISSQGGQPIVDAKKLVEWWNRLEEFYEATEKAKDDRQLSAEIQHDYGADGVVAPEIRGSVRKRKT